MNEDQGPPAEPLEPVVEQVEQAALPGLEEPEPVAEEAAPEPEAAAPLEPAPEVAEPVEPGEPEALGPRLAAVETALEAVSDHLRVVPQSLRMLTGKVNDLTTSVSESRVRSVLSALVGFFDLLDQPLRRAPDPDCLDERYHDFPLLRGQLLQVLRDQGLELIDGLEAFDPERHRAIERVPTTDAAQDGQLAELIRPGFRTAAAVLRYAEVRVYGYEAPDDPAETV